MTQQNLEAAVLLPILESKSSGRFVAVPTDSGEHYPLSVTSTLVFTVRSHKVEHHKGQISFPGGVREDSDTDLTQTALRETWEEIGLEPSKVKIISSLPPVNTVTSNFLVSPFVGVVEDTPVFCSNEDEIAEILHIPLQHLLDPRNHTIETYERAANDSGPSVIKLPVYHYNDHRIWGATAAMLARFLQRLRLDC